jgi:hypothetical protein
MHKYLRKLNPQLIQLLLVFWRCGLAYVVVPIALWTWSLVVAYINYLP